MNIIQRAFSALSGEPIEQPTDAERIAKVAAAKRLMDGDGSYFGFPRIPWDWSVDGSWRGPGTDNSSVVTPSSALTHDAVWACVRVLSEDMASLPLLIYRRVGAGKERATDHPLYETLHDFANPDMTAFQWRETMMGHVLLWGNCYSEKVYDRAGRLQLWPIPPDRMEVHWDSQQRKAYRYLHPTEGRKELDPATIFHVAGLGFDGLVGYSPVRMARSTISEGLNARGFAEGYWKRGLAQSVRWEVPDNWTDEQRAEFMRSERANHGGASNAYRSGVLPAGVKPNVLSMPLEDAQFLETRMANRNLVAGWFRVPPDKIGDLENATYSNIEQQDINYVKYSIRPWCVRVEAAVRLQLMPDDKEYFAEFLLDALLRGDSVSRAEANNIQFRAGVLLQDEWRAMENRNPLPEAFGESPMVSADMQSMGDLRTAKSLDQSMEQVKAGLLTIDEARALQNLPPMEWGAGPTPEEMASMLELLRAGVLTHEEMREAIGRGPAQWDNDLGPDEVASLLDQLKAGVLTHDEVRAMLRRPPAVWPDELAPDEVTSLIEQVKAGLLDENEARAMMKRPPMEWATGPSPDEVASLVTQVREGLLTADEARALLGRPPIAWPEDLSEKVTQANDLIKAGFDPADVMATLGLPPIRHLGLPPITLQKVTDAAGVEPAPSDGTPPVEVAL